jgi:hypothetical protein
MIQAFEGCGLHRIRIGVMTILRPRYGQQSVNLSALARWLSCVFRNACRQIAAEGLPAAQAGAIFQP